MIDGDVELLEKLLLFEVFVCSVRWSIDYGL